MAGGDNSKRVLELCDQAFALPEDERATFIDEACGGDARLRASVHSVLIAVGQAGDFLQTGDDARPDMRDLVGRRVGNYEVIAALGEGGMGSVYEARRRDGGYEQRVAIKFVHGHMLARELIERFNAERQILAALNHPYIAALIDSGTTDEGVPYIVMEYVEGVPIDEYCDGRELSIGQRIRLVQKVAMAVQAAHQNLVVHRDLKPSNVLITPDGIPKLLDFGIAKLIEPPDAGVHGNTTVFGRQAMTPDYASPEQILENKVTTASDVYTLGVLTYQLLVGERPYTIQTTSHRDMIRSVEGLTVPRPSTRLDTIASADLRRQIARQRATTIDKLQRTLQGDIDNILLMALRQEPARRYGSVAQFSDDLDRYLAGLPVAAHADTVGYRLGKFLRRNWLPVSAATLVMLSLAGGVVAYGVQAREAAAQRDIARAEARNAGNTVGFLKDVLFAGDPYTSDEKDQTVADVLKYAEENLADRYREDPASRATILAALGDIYTARADYERSRAVSAEAIALYENTLGADSNDAANAYRINALALYYMDDYENADRGFETAIDIYRSVAETDWAGLARAYDQRGMVQDTLTDEEHGIGYYGQALATYRDHDVDDPALLIAILGNLGTEHLQKGDYTGADPYLVEAIDIARQSNASKGHLGLLLANRAGVLKNIGRYDEATTHYVDAAGLLTSALGPEHPETITTLTSLANLYRQTGDTKLAGATIQKAVTAAEQGLPEDHFITSYVQNVAGSILCLGEDVPRGTELARASLETRKKLLPADHWAISSGEGIVGLCLAAAGDYEQAESILLKAYADLQQSRGETHEVTLSTRERLHDLYMAWGRPEEASRYAGPAAGEAAGT